jgi:acetoin utilization protein AcuB
MQVSIKINREDLKDIQASFERYNFNVIAVYHESEFEYQLQERYEGLMKYLEV